MKSDVVVVGGGIVGTFCSYYLAKEGLNVTWVAGNDPRSAAAWGSGGLIAPGFGAPSPTYESLSRVAKWTLEAESPIKISRGFLFKQAGWLLSYIRNGRLMDVPEARALWRQMVFEGRAVIEDLVNSNVIEPEFNKRGLLLVYLSQTKLEEHVKDLKQLGPSEVRFRELSREECRELEPHLSADLAGGVVFEDDAWLNPVKFLLQMRELVSKMGVNVVDKLASKVEVGNGSVEEVVLSSGDKVKGDNYVFALGAHTRRFLSKVGVHVPVAPAWGYTVTLAPTESTLLGPIHFGDYRITMDQELSGNIRVDGFFELSTLDHTPNPSRHIWLKDKAAELIHSVKGLEILEKWSGMRPCTPDGLPIIGRLTRPSNAVLATGHCRKGLALAPAAGRMVKDIVKSGEKHPHPLLSPERYKL